MTTAAIGPRDLLSGPLRHLAERFDQAGHRLYLVGGSVRDSLLGRPLHDIDLTTDAPPVEIKRLLGRLPKEQRPAAVYDVGEKFGTIGLVYRLAGGVPADGATAEPQRSGEPEAEQANLSVEITTYRTEQYVDGTRKPEVQFGTSLEEDLARRDFTMNALAEDLLSGDVLDPFGGASDIADRLIRAVGNPYERFREDPLRLLRAVRFAAQLGFTVEPETREAIKRAAPDLERISRERIAEELSRILVSLRPSLGLRLATELGLMRYAIPEVLPMRGVSQRPMHHKDVFEHTMGVVENIPAELRLRWAALLHDVGKPQTKSIENGEVHFIGHEDVGERMARRILRGLHFDNHFVEHVALLIRMHLRVNSYDHEWTDSAVRRLIRDAGDGLRDLILLSRADVTSYRQERLAAAAQRADAFERRCQELLEKEDVARLKSPLDGNDLMALFERPAGPWIKPIKEYLLNLVLDGELGSDDRDRAIALAKQYAESEGLFERPAHKKT